MGLLDKLNKINETKENIRLAIESTGVECDTDVVFADYPEKISVFRDFGVVSIKDVNFYDYDGKLLYSYWLDEIESLTELPPLPFHSGLIAECWNYTLSDIIETGAKCNVGVNYITDDGATRVYLNMDSDVNLTIHFSWHQSAANGVSVDFGDGTEPQTFSSGGYATLEHTYPSVGTYVIKLTKLSGSYHLANPDSDNTLISDLTDSGYAVANCLYKIELGNVIQIGGSSLRYLPGLETITIPSHITTIGGYAFYKSSSLRAIVVPRGVTTLQVSAANFNPQLTMVSLPKSVTSLGNGALCDNDRLRTFICPKYLQTIGQVAFRNNIYMTKFVACNSLSTIGVNAFSGCVAMKEYDFTALVRIPTLENSNAFTNIPSDCVIKVNASLLDEWKSATNWSVYSDYIIGV